MAKTRFTKAQMIAALSGRQSGKPVKDICRDYGICKSTFYYWKAKHAGIPIDQNKKMEVLKDEISRLKKILSNLTSENDTMKLVLQDKYGFGYVNKINHKQPPTNREILLQ